MCIIIYLISHIYIYQIYFHFKFVFIFYCCVLKRFNLFLNCVCVCVCIGLVHMNAYAVGNKKLILLEPDVTNNCEFSDMTSGDRSQVFRKSSTFS